jgi:hypothetical protein
MHPVGFETTSSASERQQTYASDGAATGQTIHEPYISQHECPRLGKPTIKFTATTEFLVPYLNHYSQ